MDSGGAIAFLGRSHSAHDQVLPDLFLANLFSTPHTPFMAEWRYPLPLQPPPGAVEPEPTLETAGWDAWAYNVARGEAATVPGARTPPNFTVKLNVSFGPWCWLARSGEEPGPWQDDHATVETRPPAPYADWRRFRRVYPRITYYEGREVRVELHIIVPPAAATRVRHFLFYQIRSGPTVARNVPQYLWVQTSWNREAAGVVYREENWDELKNAPGPIPTNGDFPSTPTPRPPEIEEREREASDFGPPSDSGWKKKWDLGFELKWDWGRERIWGFPGLDEEYARWRTAEEMRRRLGQNPKPPRPPREMDYDGDADEATAADKEEHGG